MSVKTTIKYGNISVIEDFEEPEDSIPIIYKGTTLKQLSAGECAILNTKERLCTDYIYIGGNTLYTNDKLLNDYISVSVKEA